MWFYTGVYLALALGTFLSIAVAVTTIFLVIAPHSGNTLHTRLLRTVMYAPQSYFSKTDTGRTLNRFSSDMMMIDRQLPFALFQVVQTLFRLLSQCILLAIVQPLITLTLPFTILAVYLIQKAYLATSRQLRFLDLEARALLNVSFLETLQGVATIRAFGWQPHFISDNVKKLDLSLRPDYMLMCIQRWLDMALDLMVPGLAITIIGLAAVLKGNIAAGQIGIALNVVLQTNQYLLRLVEAWTKLETSLGSISRLRAFEQEVRPEDDQDRKALQSPPPAWPIRGAVEFANLSASYNRPALALNNISIKISSGTKVGVVGRTGSGKSSLLLSLLRLIELEGQGTVLVDGLDVRALPRNAVRSRIITVPQDPMLVMTDTVRENLDVTGVSGSDDDMVSVLRKVRLWDALQARGESLQATAQKAIEVEVALRVAGSNGSESRDRGDNFDEDSKKPLLLSDEEGADRGGVVESPTTTSSPNILNMPMSTLLLSQGQQQLFSLARALLMRSSRGRVVLLDEATSNVDAETDRLMQALVREEFREHTVITVAHRLETVMDSDVVLVMDGGRLVEAGPPGELVEREGGWFRGLARGKTLE